LHVIARLVPSEARELNDKAISFFAQVIYALGSRHKGNKMYCIIYRFKVIEGKEEDFIKLWSKVTSAFRTNCGALGSRLHINDKCDYIAYAQWPSKEIVFSKGKVWTYTITHQKPEFF